MLGHVGDDAVEERTGAFKAGIGVDFDEPGLELAVYHKVKPENLKIIH